MTDQAFRQAFELYQKWGFCVIPVARNSKKALVDWKPYESRKPTLEELTEWWGKYWSNGNEANIGVVCGRVSGNLVALDFDSKKHYENFMLERPELYDKTLVVRTGQGFHVYVRTREPCKSYKVDGIDIKGEGGYVVAPPSVHPEGSIYQFINPDIGQILAVNNLEEIGIKSTPRLLGKRFETMLKGAGEGERNNTAFAVARGLKNNWVNLNDCLELLMVWNERNKPPLPAKELEDTVRSAYSREGGSTQAIREFISQTQGSFSVSQLDNELGITGQQKAFRKLVIHRLQQEGAIERLKPGYYRVKEATLPDMNWQGADTSNWLDLEFPFRIHELVEIYPRNILILAGIPNAGKTALLLNFIKLNMQKFNIHYFTSELSEQELKKRLEKFGDGVDWQFHPHERNSDFDGVIIPDAINVIDYLEPPSGEYYVIGDQIASIHSRLTAGIAFIAIQKKRKAELGRGAEFSEERARLYLSMDSGELKIVKAKNWKTGVNPNGMVYTFKLADGCRFQNVRKA